MDQPLFEDTETGARRSILFAIAIATGALCFVAAMSVVVSSADAIWALPLAALGIAAIVLGGYLQQGHLDQLVDDEEFIWRQG